MKVKVGFKSVCAKIANLLILYPLVFGGLLSPVQAANTSPANLNTVINRNLDIMKLPANVFIWDNEFGGTAEPGCDNKVACNNNDFVNSLICFSSDNVAIGACPTRLFWQKSSPSDGLTLRFTHSDGQTRDLNITSIKASGGFKSWMAGTPLYPGGFSTFIPSSQLKKLSVAGVWRAKLMMWVSAWDNCGDDVNGCTGMYRATWQADITLNVIDNSNQQIYLPAFPTSTPVINLNLNSRPGAAGGSTVSGSTQLDMCLYDGNDSASNRISLLLQDERGPAAGRPAGRFSLYRRGGDKTKASDRLDYRVSVINPTTGATQIISNGTEIVWSNTNRRNIQRQVMLPGSTTPALCVPAPLILATPAFSMTSKNAGDYTGRLRIIYTPSTQTGQ